MDGTYYRFKEIMSLVEQNPNDMTLGGKVREYYWLNWKKQPSDPAQLKIKFPEDGLEEDPNIDEIAQRGYD